MEHTWWERASILLETLAFYSVTIELYGETNLLKLQQKVQMLTGDKLDASDAITFVFFRVMTPLNGWVSSLLSIIMYCVSPYAFKIFIWDKLVGRWHFFNQHSIINHVVIFILGITMGGLCIFLVTLVLLLMAGCLGICIQLSIKLLKSYSVRGWMLIGGAVLFAISKTIAFCLA